MSNIHLKYDSTLGLTNGKILKFYNSSAVTDSLLSESGTGVTVNGSVQIYGNVDILGTATTFNTQTVQAADNNITLNLSGSHVTALYGGMTVLSGKTDGTPSTWTIDTNGNWSGNTGVFIASGLTVQAGTIVSGSTDINNLFADKTHSHVQYATLSGATFTGNVFVPTLSATTLSATTLVKSPIAILGSGSTADSGLALDIHEGTARWSIGKMVGTPNEIVLYGRIGTPSATNYALLAGSTVTQVNAVTAVFFSIGGTVNASVYGSSMGVNIGGFVPSAKMHIRGTTEQLRLDYDVNNYFSTTVSSAGAVRFGAVGSNSGFTFSAGLSASSLSATTIQLASGTTTVAPIKLSSGTNLTSPEVGAIEFDGTDLHFTDNIPSRQTIATEAFVNSQVTTSSKLFNFYNFI